MKIGCVKEIKTARVPGGDDAPLREVLCRPRAPGGHPGGRGGRMRASRTPSTRRRARVIEQDRKKIFAGSDMIIKVKEPQPEEYPLLREGQILFTYLHLAADQELTRRCLGAGSTAWPTRPYAFPTAPCPASSP